MGWDGGARGGRKEGLWHDMDGMTMKRERCIRKGRLGVWVFVEGLYGLLLILMVAFGINGISSYNM